MLTCHRRENWGEPMANIFTAVRDVVKAYEDIEVVFPVHKNPLVREIAAAVFNDVPRIHLVEPLDYLPFCHVMQRSFLVLTDSGGLQEEAPALGKPVLVLRDTTERPEAVEAGTAMLIGTEQRAVETATKLLLEDNETYARMAQAINPYGDGYAARRIVEIIKDFI